MPKAASQPSNDPDFVKYTKYTKKAGVLPDLPRDPPLDWRPLRINNPHVIGSPLLPEGIRALSLPLDASRILAITRFIGRAIETFTPIESVPVSLVLAVNAHGRRLFPPGLHSVWDNNLFNTIPILEYLQQHGVGCAGTVRTTKTRTKEAYEKTAVIELEAKDAAI
ncbi:hypothetical protein BU23DRAFT_634401 [Bimuria novae-zelandiae CBS 107.79]|uniref:PiggyBac transposable element-derived protein domain-containing protein n=1 Tax=Bimuria novae-zelandiae CBS 107.79 TaxID=1447943 RepID=A0A6A5VFU8_9PLEO|nr:hypothetical protein BU23DRAFT_634401 [Bimuria novae-zelandiae CBS 107.79]